MTIEEIMREAFTALLRGDTAERDRLCALAKQKLLEEREQRRIAITAQIHRKPGNA